MNRNRKSGILLHVTSLPSDQGVGNFGPDAYRFVDFLHRAGQSWWQVLPLGPPGYGNSPYQCYSAFAGNPLLISQHLLAKAGLLDTSDLSPSTAYPADHVDFAQVAEGQHRALAKAFDRFQTRRGDMAEQLEAFISEHAAWLNDYALFRAIKTAYGGKPWWQWDRDIRLYHPEAVARYRQQLQHEIMQECFVQFLFHQQWTDLRTYAHERGLQIMGDVPIFVAHDSADVWSNQPLFALDHEGAPQVVAGVPPDYFSETGQLWGNPLYRWDRMAETGYAWWVERLRHAMTMFDAIRMDHFRGFESYWEVPGDAVVAAAGRWVRGPGALLFQEARQRLGNLPIVAEDLGVITPQVEALRDELGFPGMRVLQFAFGNDPKASDYQPHNYIHDCVVYTGTHDNDTVVGWFWSKAGEGTTRTAEEIEAERARVLEYVATDGHEIHWDMIRLALASVAKTAIFPLQDLLGLGSSARMNMPGTVAGNWRWRFRWEAITPAIEQRLAAMTRIYERWPATSSKR